MKEVIRMNYGRQVLARLMNPGTALLIIGAVAVYGSGWIARRLAPDKGENANLICKGIGCAVALAGVLLLLDIL